MPINFNANSGIRNVNVGNLGADPRAVMHMSASLQKCRNFGKAWDVGDQGTVFYPFKWWPDASLPAGGQFEPHMSAYFGHQVSYMKALGTTFLRSLSPIDENGQVIGNGDLAYQFSKVSRLLVNAKKEQELATLNSKDWKILGDNAYQTARKAVEDKYDAKTNINAVRPLIGQLTVLKITEVVYVAMDANSGTPIFEDQRKQRTGNYIQTLSDSRLAKIRSFANDISVGILAQNPDMVPEENVVYFLEVIYNFSSTHGNKSEAGRSDPQGVAHATTLLAKNPANKDKLQRLLDRVPKDPEGISGHTYNMSPMSDEVLKSKLQAVMFDCTSAMPFLSPEDKDRLVKNAQLLDYLRIAPNEDPELNARLTEELGHPVGEAPLDTAPTIDSIMGGDSDAPDFSRQVADAGMIDDMLSGGMDDMAGL